MKTSFTIKLTDGGDGWITAECPEMPGCFSQGRTQLSAIRNISEAICAILKFQADDANAKTAIARKP